MSNLIFTHEDTIYTDYTKIGISLRYDIAMGENILPTNSSITVVANESPIGQPDISKTYKTSILCNCLTSGIFGIICSIYGNDPFFKDDVAKKQLVARSILKGAIKYMIDEQFNNKFDHQYSLYFKYNNSNTLDVVLTNKDLVIENIIAASIKTDLYDKKNITLCPNSGQRIFKFEEGKDHPQIFKSIKKVAMEYAKEVSSIPNPEYINSKEVYFSIGDIQKVTTPKEITSEEIQKHVPKQHFVIHDVIDASDLIPTKSGNYAITIADKMPYLENIKVSATIVGVDDEPPKDIKSFPLNVRLVNDISMCGTLKFKHEPLNMLNCAVTVNARIKIGTLINREYTTTGNGKSFTEALYNLCSIIMNDQYYFNNDAIIVQYLIDEIFYLSQDILNKEVGTTNDYQFYYYLGKNHNPRLSCVIFRKTPIPYKIINMTYQCANEYHVSYNIGDGITPFVYPHDIRKVPINVIYDDLTKIGETIHDNLQYNFIGIGIRLGANEKPSWQACDPHTNAVDAWSLTDNAVIGNNIATLDDLFKRNDTLSLMVTSPAHK